MIVKNRELAALINAAHAMEVDRWRALCGGPGSSKWREHAAAIAKAVPRRVAGLPGVFKAFDPGQVEDQVFDGFCEALSLIKDRTWHIVETEAFMWRYAVDGEGVDAFERALRKAFPKAVVMMVMES